MAISAVEPDRFRVDFGRLDEDGLLSRLRGMLSRPGAVVVDPYRVGRAVCEVMSRSAERDVHGRLLVWNEFRVYLSRADYDASLWLELQHFPTTVVLRVACIHNYAQVN